MAVLTRRGTGGPAGAEAFAGDLTTGAGLERALAGVACVIDCANVTTASKRASVDYFTSTTQRLQKAAAAAQVSHHVVLSILHVDRVPFGYYVGKLAQENVAQAGPVPVTVLRAAQFHEFAGQVLRQLRLGPLSVVPAMRVQPVAATEVAAALADAVEAGPRVRAPDIAGPRPESLPDLARQLIRHRGEHRAVLGLPLPGRVGRMMRNGDLLPGPDAVRRGPTFAAWLREQPAPTKIRSR